jgi:hypothetical protein
MAGVQGRHCFAEPVPLVGSGWGRDWRKLVWGKQKLSHSTALRGGRAKVSPKPWNWVKAHETGCCYPVGENLWFKSHLTKA